MSRRWLGVVSLCTTLLAPPASASLIFTEFFSSYRADGIGPTIDGALDSNSWRVAGLSSGDTDFGAVLTGGDYGRGRSPGGVGTGGIYGFDVNQHPVLVDTALGFQPTASDFTPGTLELRIRNLALTSSSLLYFAFDLYARNDGPRSTRVALSLFDSGRTALLSDLEVIRTPAQAGATDWIRTRVVDELAIPNPTDSLLARWTFSDDIGSGARDEVALDNVVFAVRSMAHSVSTPTTFSLVLLGVIALRLAGRRSAGPALPHTPRA